MVVVLGALAHDAALAGLRVESWSSLSSGRASAGGSRKPRRNGGGQGVLVEGGGSGDSVGDDEGDAFRASEGPHFGGVHRWVSRTVGRPPSHLGRQRREVAESVHELGRAAPATTSTAAEAPMPGT